MRATFQVCLAAIVLNVGLSFTSNISKSKAPAISMSTVALPEKPMNNFWNRLMFSIGLNKRVRTDQELKKGIANFYDESSQVWLDVWVSNLIILVVAYRLCILDTWKVSLTCTESHQQLHTKKLLQISACIFAFFLSRSIRHLCW